MNGKSDSPYSHAPNLAYLLNEIMEELKESAQTRLQILKSELSEKAAKWKAGAILGAAGLLLLLTSFLLLNLALVGLVAVVFWGSAYVWFLSFLIVGGLWVAIGSALALYAIRKFKSSSLIPAKSLRVLRQDVDWLENEARSQI